VVSQTPLSPPPATPAAASEPARATASEYAAATQGCALIDISERGKLALTGAEAKDFLHGQVTNDILGLEPGHGCYAAFLTHKGKMLGDLRVLDFGEELFLDCERSALQALFSLINRFKLGRQVELHKRTLQSGLLSLIGPQARAVASAGGLGPVEHDNAPAEIAGVPVRLIATHLGVDVLCAAEDTAQVVERLTAAGAVPVPEAVLEVVRVERGRPRYGVDLDDTVIPQEAALNERAVSFTKGCYVGQETVARLFYKGKPNRHLRGLRLGAPATTGAELRLGDRVVGHLGSVAVSPVHGIIALALVRREAAPGDTVAVGDGSISATLTQLPFAAP
jgi:folate-binding protein YgfZ